MGITCRFDPYHCSRYGNAEKGYMCQINETYNVCAQENIREAAILSLCVSLLDIAVLIICVIALVNLTNGCCKCCSCNIGMCSSMLSPTNIGMFYFSVLFL